MNRLHPKLVCLFTLIASIIILSCQYTVSAQNRRFSGSISSGTRKPWVSTKAAMPREITRTELAKTRGAAIPQTLDLTTSTPKVIDGAPYWSRDEQFIVFQSNRTDLNGSKVPPANSPFHIYRMRQDGSNVTALTGPLSSLAVGQNNSQAEPSFNTGGSTIFYVETTTAGSVDLIELNLSTNVARSLVKNNPNGFTFTALNGPEHGFAIGGNVGVIFSGLVPGGSYHLYTVDIQSGQVAQLTFGAFDDMNPTLSPDPAKPVVAFDRGPAGNPAAPRDIYVIGTNPNVQNTKRVTTFSAAGKSSSNMQPAWSTDKLDQPSGNQRFVRGQQLIGFATTRMDSANDGVANAVNANGTHEIYWLKINIGIDPNNTSVFTVTNPNDTPQNIRTPEDVSNRAFKLPTSDPQHIYNDTYPTWPQFIATYRIGYQTDRTFYDPGTNNSGPNGQPGDIFASTLLDINTPTLIRYDEVTGDVLRVEPRISAPLTRVKISAKLVDYETGVRDVWVQIKNPNSKYQSSDNKEHKVYGFGTRQIDGGSPFPLVFNAPDEYDYERIYVGDDPNDARVNSYAAPRYTSSVDDFYAFTGSGSAPDPGWLKLNLESTDPVTGISTYSAYWTTDRFPSDYYVDLITYDNAVNPFAGGGRVNWRIYDNVWGFTTKNFIPNHGILWIGDYSCGQKFFGGKFGASALTNVAYSFWGSEAWLTDYDVTLHPDRYAADATNQYPIVNAANTIGVKSFMATDAFVDGSQDDGTRIDGFPLPPVHAYDLWRVLCRGPVPDSVLAQYVPHKESQPADKLAGETQDRTVTVSPRIVFWDAPFAGGVFNGAGSITDLSVQVQLHNFLAAGGRLIVSGQDVAWALTLGGAATNGFLTNDLKAQYVSDDPGNGMSRFENSGGFVYWFMTSSSYALTSAATPNPIVHDPWELAGWNIAANHCYPGPPVPPNCVDFINSSANYVGSGTPGHGAAMASLGVKFPDRVNAIAPAVADFSYAGGGVAMQHYEDTTTGQRLLYIPMGLEGLNTESWVLNNIMYFKNRRAEVMHNAGCWMRTGAVIGTVRDVAGGNPLPDTLVKLSHRVNATGQRVWDYTALTGPDGSFVINGVEAGAYEITAVKPGYTIQKRSPVVTHGGFRDNTGLRMTVAEPAVIKGKVTRLDGVTPVVGATVTATDVVNPALVFTATTDANGNYSLDRVPSQTKYRLTAAAQGYGESIPLSYLIDDSVDPSGQNLLQPAKVYEPYNFKLKPVPGSMTGGVFVKNADGSKGAPIANATVTATMGLVNVTAITDSSGGYSFNENNSPANGLDPGEWSLVASAPGFAANSPAVKAFVISQQNVVASDILIGTVPPGSISGLATRTSDGAALPGVLIQLKDASGNVITSTTTTTEKTDATGYRYNYKINSVPAGVTYTVTATRNGFTSNPVSRNAAVTSGTETKSILFAMDPLHTFSGNLSLVSAPYDYSGYSLANDVTGQGGLLDIPQGNVQNGTFMFAAWDTGRYAFYPAPPANTFRLGRGHFLAYKSNMPLSVQGTPADATRSYDIPLNIGWNMIGDPFPFDIDWTKISIVDGAQVRTYQEAVSSGAISSGLYGYLSSTYLLSYKVEPWRGYWLRAYRNVVLRIDPVNDRYGRSAEARGGNSRAVLQGGTGWSVNLRLNVADTRDEDNHFGVSTRAEDGFDGFKVEKPPVFGNRYSYLAFNHENWADKSGSYGVDVRSTAIGGKAWEFSVQTTEAKTSATLTWPNAATAPRGTTLTLTDLATGQARDMRTSSSYSWPTGDVPVTRKFRIEASASAGPGLRITNITTRGGSRGHALGVGFNLSQSANVDIRIVGMTGAVVRKLIGRASRAAGINEVTWDTKNDQNVSVPSGQYSLEIRAQSLDGKSTVRQIAPITIVR